MKKQIMKERRESIADVKKSIGNAKQDLDRQIKSHRIAIGMIGCIALPLSIAGVILTGLGTYGTILMNREIQHQKDDGKLEQTIEESSTTQTSNIKPRLYVGIDGTEYNLRYGDLESTTTETLKSATSTQEYLPYHQGWF